jgi:hypothetical protein
MNEDSEQVKHPSSQDVAIRKIAEEMDRTVVFCALEFLEILEYRL